MSSHLLENIVPHLLARVESHEARWLIAIAGVPGSGKSTLAARLAEEVNRVTEPDTLVALGMDGFHLTKAELSQMPDPAEAFARRGAPWTFDVQALHSRVLGLRDAAGSADMTWPGFQHEIGDPIDGAFVVPARTRLVIVEGLYLLHCSDGWEAISTLFDERWYLDISLDTSLERLARRHMQVWNITREVAENRIATNDITHIDIIRGCDAFSHYRN